MTAMWSGEAQAHYDLCQVCDGIVEGSVMHDRFEPYRGRVVDGETWCVECYNALVLALALACLTVPTC